ncbi:MAG: hypothetical protein V4447_06505 [Pseudomonadota bacterium]
MKHSPYRSLYTYAWDVQDIGVTAFVDELLAMGVNDVTLATSYHAGKFIRPHAKNAPRVIFPEDGVVYFDPDFSRYAEIQPQAHSDAKIRAVLPALLKDGRLKVHGWTVLLHNSRIGAAAPQYTVKNAFGDPYVYSLCPMQPAVFSYAVALCADLATQHDLTSLVLETPGWLPYGHGYHHEFAQVASNACLDILLGLCFCPACKMAAKKNGIAIDGLQTEVKKNISDYLAHPFDAVNDRNASTLQSEILKTPDFLAFTKLRQTRVTELVQAIRQAIPTTTKLAVIPTVQRPTSACWIEGSDLIALSEVADYLEIPFYEASASRAIADAEESIAQIGSADKVRAILRPGLPDLNQGAEIAEAMAGIQALGVADFAFYNYGLLPQTQLDKLEVTLQKESADGA